MVKFFSDTAWLIPLLASELFEKTDNTQFWPHRFLMMWFYINNPVYMPKEMKPHIDALPYKGVKKMIFQSLLSCLTIKAINKLSQQDVLTHATA